MSQVSIPSLLKKKQAKQAFAVITCYDAGFAKLVEKAGIDAILVGDSLGMVVQGHESTLPVSVEEMAYHTRCVARAVQQPLIITDLPFGSYNTENDCLRHATTLMQAGAAMVKLEGGSWLCDSIVKLNRAGIPVCGHLGLTPQSVNLLGGYRVQGREDDKAEAMLRDALALEQAGASLLVLECVPQKLAAQISETLSIPVIGIGAGNVTDAQVLVLHDLLGVTEKTAKFVRNFADGASSIEDALVRYKNAVEERSFPADEHTFS
ncbi:3-methyl-2-oxobutanoate hydroxymethyltransferase [Spongiibacter taiwanensis]|uniref:3-methyl-2-oxobutanoate hydroxymethyltransferase n=1 Tax=Spongiibacter taiwanensis TaxID=1748242 RepID=UPI002035F8EC|nr:3-methyl-2-oxobutanoate hydroxymethyltransferase [Spongiibacter taiwanensis]USA44670.1 3-methyl-2-oxobutanoate hydroxymethyltransferase [Spongiibacter taiwanensis]